MKLPDFRNAIELNQLRSKMNAELIDLSTINWQSLNTNELLDKLNNPEGILLESINDISFCDDGTFEFQGQKVLIYIRDQRHNPNYPNREYKFHICNCDVIESFISNNRFDRYVASRNTNGKFIINIIDSYSKNYIEKNKEVELKVCKKCLIRFKYKGYSDFRHDDIIYRQFKLEEFFNLFKTQHTKIPKYNDQTAPPDLYSSDSKDFNIKLKASRKWRCDSCGIDLSEHKRFLNVHHINGVKSDNRLVNLKCLCIKCHSNQPDHYHLKWSHDFFEFNKLFGDKRN